MWNPGIAFTSLASILGWSVSSVSEKIVVIYVPKDETKDLSKRT